MGGGHGGPPPKKSMKEAFLKGMMKIVLKPYIILGPHAKNQDPISKIDRDFEIKNLTFA